MKHPFALSVLAASALAAIIGSSAHAQSSYTLTDLGTFGGTICQANGVNNSGHVAGSSSPDNSYNDVHAFYWENGKLTDLCGTVSHAWGINNADQLVGDVGGHAFLWSKANPVVVDLNTYLNPTDAQNWVLTDARAINDNGQVAGNGLFNGASHAYLLDLSTHLLTDLTASGWTSSSVFTNALNNSAQVVGSQPNGSFLYSGGAFTLLSIGVYGINNAGEIAGNASAGVACYRTAGGTVVTLPSLYGGSTARDINTPINAYPKMAVGVSGGYGVRWQISTGTVTDLNKITKKGKWSIGTAMAISDSGYIVARTVMGTSGPNYSALLTPQ